MKRNISFLIIIILLVFAGQKTFAKDWTIDVTVAKDGSGDYLTITEAIDAKPSNGSNYVIYIKNGVYNEALFITDNNITLLGEDRDETIITQAILRRIFRETNPSDWGVATINIENGVTDLTLANLTVRNNFADLNPSVPDNNDHTMAIRGGGDRIIIINCNITATGGDTLSLWNTDGGRFYHSGCYFEGYVDFVCPRGYCFINNSDFFGYNDNASIWHDGSGGKDHKFVIRNSYFDGKNFGLGRFHRMSAFYLLDCDFSAELRNNGGILYVGDSVADDRDKLIYGIRTYYDRCSRVTGDYEWHQDNLSSAEGSPTREEINDEWTFLDTWKPEIAIQGLLECAFLPQPGYHEKDVEATPVLSWLPGKNAVSHLIYFGTDSIAEFVAEVTDTSYAITDPLGSAIKYYWHIDEILSSGDTVRGPLWTFSTLVSGPPAQVSDPYPAVDEDYQISTVPLQWQANTLEVDTFHVYFGGVDNLDLISSQKTTGYFLSGLIRDTVYYWRVDAQNEFGTTEGPLWYFNYRIEDATNINSNFIDNNALRIYPNPAEDEVTVSLKTNENEKVVISVYDSLGRRIYQKDLGILCNENINHTIDLNDIRANGNKCLYLIQVDLGAKSETYPFIIQ